MNKILSLFSGAGGIDIGFKSNSFQTYAAVDNWDIACDTLKKNRISKNVICSDIKNVNFSKFKGKVDIVVGGGIRTPEDAGQLVNSGASFVVIGSAIENSKELISDFASAIHQ